LFVGTEFGLFTSVDGGTQYVQLKGGLPVTQVRDLTLHKRENDVVLATFGRGFYVLDDYSALREISSQTLAEPARLFPLRHAYAFVPGGLAPAGAAGTLAISGNFSTPNPPVGAWITYSVKDTLPADAKLVLTISDNTGKQVRRCELDRSVGLRRLTWNLNSDPVAPDRDRGTADRAVRWTGQAAADTARAATRHRARCSRRSRPPPVASAAVAAARASMDWLRRARPTAAGARHLQGEHRAARRQRSRQSVEPGFGIVAAAVAHHGSVFCEARRAYLQLFAASAPSSALPRTLRRIAARHHHCGVRVHPAEAEHGPCPSHPGRAPWPRESRATARRSSTGDRSA
jgi:hypothetical protein